MVVLADRFRERRLNPIHIHIGNMLSNNNGGGIGHNSVEEVRSWHQYLKISAQEAVVAQEFVRVDG